MVAREGNPSWHLNHAKYMQTLDFVEKQWQSTPEWYRKLLSLNRMLWSDVLECTMLWSITENTSYYSILQPIIKWLCNYDEMFANVRTCLNLMLTLGKLVTELEGL